MKRFLLPGVLAFASIAFAQTFEVASVRINQSGSAGGEGRTEETIVSAPGSLTMKNVTLLSCVKWAYDLRDFQISGGPGWLGSERYDILAKAGTPAGDAELKKMLRALLAERFELRVREEMKPLPVYAMVVAKSVPGLKPAAGNEAESMRPGEGALEFRNTSMGAFAERLAKRPLSVDRPVVDRTGLSGAYDFSLRFANNAAELKGALEDIDRGKGESLFSVIREQLGLKLEPEKAALRAIVVESATETPKEN